MRGLDSRQGRDPVGAAVEPAPRQDVPHQPQRGGGRACRQLQLHACAVSGLSAAGNNIELNLEVDSNRDRRDLKAWFDEIWNDRNLVEDVTAEVLRYLEQLYQNHAPEFIYYKTLFHLFQSFIDTGKDLDASLQKTSLLETAVWKALFDFQKDGAKAAINKIRQYNGCILADSVGLGKTFEALAVIKYFELKNERALVLCPKKLARQLAAVPAEQHAEPFRQGPLPLRCAAPHRPLPRVG